MNERVFLQPPEIVEKDRPVIFLAGPVQGAPDWQSVAGRTIQDIDPSIIVASPRKNYPEGTFVYERQVDWETRFLRVAGETGAIAFWLANQVEPTPGRAYGQTSRFEIGEWLVRHIYTGAPLTVGFEEDFGNIRYFRHRFAKSAPDVKFTDNFEELCQNAVDLAQSRPLAHPTLF
jgi:hypothetical protein